MNSHSLALNGRPPTDLALTTSHHHQQRTPTSNTTKPYPRQPPSSKSTSTQQRPPYKRSPPSSSTSSGWYNTENTPTLDDIAARLNTTLSRFEQWQSRCAQNVVMALIGPTPVVLFVLNPVAL
ncbi:hypothetical protein B0A55_09534, partial [Friedmanniomyces simplex]